MRVLIFVLLLFAAALPARAEPPAPRPVEQFARLPFMMGPRMSPDGTRYAAVVAVSGRQMLAIVKLKAGPDSIALVSLGDDSDLNWWEWVNDEHLIAGVGGMDNVLGTEMYLRRTISISADGKTIKALAASKAAQNADDVIWIANDGSPRILLALQTAVFSDAEGFTPEVHEVNVATGKTKPILSSRANVWAWYADASGAVRIGVGYVDRTRTSFLLYRPGAEGSFRMVERANRRRDQDLIVPVLFTADPGKAMAFSDHEGFESLYELDLATMKLGALVFKADGYDLDSIIANEARDTVQGAVWTDTRRRVKWFDPDMAQIQSQIDAAVGGRQADIVSMSRDRQKLIIRLGAPDRSSRYYYFDRADGRMRKFAETNADFAGRPQAPVRTVHYKARDGLDISGVLTVPPGREAKGLPLILMPHGGPFARDSEEWNWWVQFLADRGYAVLQPNYRGSSGFGTAFAQKGEGQWGLKMQDDLDDAVAWAVKEGLADPARVCIAGASYGGYAALRAASRGGDTYKCAISYAGVSDLNAMVRYDRKFLNSGASRDWLRQQAPDFRTVSPINQAASFSMPTLIMHGRKDRTVPVGQSRDMAGKLEKAGKAHTYIEQPEGDHHFSREADRLQFLKELEAFLKKYNPA
ncbi:MAG TPA: prolyl oligopeptidase family serine peptidase [Allosphingosinicella sp.]